MAATPAEIAASLTIDEIPVKLRCAACNKLANNAFRTPCCDQAICEDCQSSLPQACPICLHEPVKAEDCRPNKALRTTIKVFLKKKGIEREAARRKEMVDQAAATPATPASTQAHETTGVELSQTPRMPPASDVEGKVDPMHYLDRAAHPPETANGSDIQNTAQVLPEEAQMDIARPSIESSNEEIQPNSSEETGGGINGVQEKIVQGEQDYEQQKNGHDEHLGSSVQWPSAGGMEHGMANNSFGFDGTNGFPNVGFNGTPDFTQMMQFMPNGMTNSAMGAFPNMLGMPGMGLDPMNMSQGMYGGFGGQGVGMNGMNVGMGFNAGQGAFGGFNGQPGAWNTGQDKFNQNAYGGHANGMGGDFGPVAGYDGYNMPSHQGNFNQMHHHQYPNNDYQSGYNGQGFHNRGRGRGRGFQNAGRGRGGYNQVIPGNQTNYEPFHHQIPQQLAQQASSHQQISPQVNQQPAAKILQNPQTQQETSVDQADLDKAANEQLAKELEPGDAEDVAKTPTNSAQDGNIVKESMPAAETTSKAQDQTTVDLPAKQEEDKPAAIETFISSERTDLKTNGVNNEIGVSSSMMLPPNPVIPLGPAALYSGEQHPDYSSRGRTAGRGYHRGTPDYRGGMRGRGSGYLANSVAHQPAVMQPHIPTEAPVATPAEPKGLGVEGAPKAPKALREGLPNTGIRGGRGFSIVGRASAAAQARPSGHARSRSRSRTRSRSPSRHSHHHRSRRHRSVSSSGGSEHERRRERHHRRSRKYEDKDDVSEEAKETRTGDALGESKRTSHRSHRDSEKDRGEVRSSHRSHRSRDERHREQGEEIRPSRKRSRSPNNDVNGVRIREASDTIKSLDSRQKDKHEEPSSSARKRRDRDEEDNHRERDRKRSRLDHRESAENKENHSRSRHSKRDETDPSSKYDAGQRTQEKMGERTKPSPKKPEMDHHELEREARNRERLQKELQRREAMEGKAPAGKKKDSLVNGRAGGGSRRVSYKYEDEETNEARATRIESEREAGRWG